jgi:hypothetical protein
MGGKSRSAFLMLLKLENVCSLVNCTEVTVWSDFGRIGTDVIFEKDMTTKGVVYPFLENKIKKNKNLAGSA